MPRIVKFVPIRPHPIGPHRVVALALPGVVALDLAAPAHLFGHCGAPHYAFSLAGVRRGRVPTSTGFDVIAPHGLDALNAADTVVVPGLDTSVDGPTFGRAARAVAGAHARGARVVSICTGAFVLAAAGLLDGRRATTHWASAARLARDYPLIDVDPDVLYVDEGSVLTSAGVAAGLDLCLHVIRRDHGAALAAAIARRTVVAPHRDGGQAQFLTRPINPCPPDPGPPTRSLAATMAWALEHLGERLDVATLARHACSSPRSFARHFVLQTGTTPAQWLLEQRTRAAQALLEASELPVEQVAIRTGFGSAATMRAQFTRRLSTTPTAYRRSFRAR